MSLKNTINLDIFQVLIRIVKVRQLINIDKNKLNYHLMLLLCRAVEAFLVGDLTTVWYFVVLFIPVPKRKQILLVCPVLLSQTLRSLTT